MGFDKEKMKQIRYLMVFAAFLVLLVIYSDRVVQGVKFVVGIASPFLCGGMIAFVLNLPMRAIEGKILKKWRGKIANKCKRPVSMVLAMLVIVLVATVVIATVVPQVTKALTELGKKIPLFFDKVAVQLEQFSDTYPEINEQVEALESLEVNWNDIVSSVTGFLKNGAVNMLSSTFSVAGSIIGGVVNFVIALVFAIYILAQKEKLASQGNRVLKAYLPEKAAKYTERVLVLLNKNFASFITGQCLEAVILGCMFIICMSIFRMPYAVMVGMLIACTALIPIVGAFIGCAVGAFLILIDNPILAVWFVVMFLILQQIEGNLIYPKVVGNSVGLPSIWVLAAVSLGGSLFGVVGMLFFIPLTATAYTLLRENVNDRNQRKGRKPENAISHEKNLSLQVEQKNPRKKGTK